MGLYCYKIILRCRSGGIGRRARFRFLWGIPRGCSSHLFGTSNSKGFQSMTENPFQFFGGNIRTNSDLIKKPLWEELTMIQFLLLIPVLCFSFAHGQTILFRKHPRDTSQDFSSKSNASFSRTISYETSLEAASIVSE